MKEKYLNFLKMAKLLNDKFNIQPLLYGSLGLEVVTEANLNADDVDVLVPEIFIKSKWNDFRQCLESQGYKMIDLHEHTFENGNIHFSFASIESLETFANIKLSEIKTQTRNKVNYKLLTLKQYLKVYEASSKDSYRKRINKNTKDESKIEFIKLHLEGKDEGI